MEPYVITISRRFASNGHVIAARMGELLGIPVYDRSAVEARMQSLVREAEPRAEKPGETADAKDAKEPARTGRDLLRGLFRREVQEEEDSEARLAFERQSAVMQSLAAEGSCIILGRCGDYVFRDAERSMHIFIYASDSVRLHNSMEMLHTGEAEARALIAQEDRARDAYRRQFCGDRASEVQGRHILIDSGRFGAEATAQLLAEAARVLFDDIK